MRSRAMLYIVTIKVKIGNMEETTFDVSVEDYTKGKAIKRAIEETNNQLKVTEVKTKTVGKLSRVIKKENYTS